MDTVHYRENLVCPSQKKAHREAKMPKSRIYTEDLQEWDFVDLECPSQEELHRLAKKLGSRTFYETNKNPFRQPIFDECPSQEEAHRNAKRRRLFMNEE